MLIQAIGAPFNTEFSSNGTRRPLSFSWTKEPKEIQVYIDSGLVRGANGSKNNKKFGWFCESRIVRNNVYRDIVNNIQKYKNSYHKIFTCDKSLLDIDKELFSFSFSGSNLPWTQESDYGIHEKTKIVSLLSSDNRSTEGHLNRIQIAEKYKNSVDLYGGIFGGKKIGITQDQHYHHKSKKEALNDYMFSVTIENCKYETYFTEKLTDCFANGVIPVYYGTENISNYFDVNGVIFLNDSFDVTKLNRELYESKLNNIKNNLRLVKELRSSDDYLLDKIRELI